MQGSPATRRARLISRRVVHAEPPVPEAETIHLTPWDLRMITIDYIQKGVLLPTHQQPAATGAAVDRLASSFARALGRFYPFAGRLVAQERADATITVSLRCTDEGAQFVHAVAPDVTAADITGGLYIPRELVRSLFPLNGLLSADAAVNDPRRPLLAAQVTELADAIFVAVSLNHAIGDGTTFWHFVNTWSEISRSGCAGERHALPPPPVLKRWFLDTCPVPIPLPFAKLEHVVRRCEQPPPLQECFFHFSVQNVQKLKARANAEVVTTSTISSLQALLAHLWRSVSRARALEPSSQEIAYVLLIGCRGRVKGIPPGYVGNAVVPCMVKSTAGEVLEKGLGWTAWLLNRAVASFDEASMRDSLERWTREPRLAYTADMLSTAAVGTGSSPRFDVYGNDFGWGKPVAVRSGPGNKLDGKSTVYEGRDGGGSVALELCLAPDAMARLVVDDEFMDAVTAP